MIKVTITFEYDTDTLPGDHMTPAEIDQQSFEDGEFDIPELLEWAEGDIDVKFESI
jgi:hypothetical protein